ncbi:glycosyltransferase family 4 protein [Simplicispira psychrophila]|uniref:glycosyltransferase family 4 protein n=1 Tax=Simplicispira psychrophila TaxID=80882 RepID=UPI000486A97E|nr:glycosyltransferase family 4 protein [Simplicispira psychrophila]
MSNLHPAPCHLFVLPWSLEALGGVNQVVISLAQAMYHSGSVRPLVLVCDWNAPQPVWQRVQGVQTVRWRIRSWPAQAGIKEKLAFLAWMWQFQPAFERFCQTYQVVAINPHSPGKTALTLHHAVRRFSQPVPFVFSFHGSDIEPLQTAPPAIKKHWRALLHQAQRIVVCSADLGRRVVQALGEDLPLQLIYNGIDTASFTGLPATARTAPHLAGRVILSVGKFIPLKGQDVLIRAFVPLAQEYADLQLVLVGASGNALAGLQQLCAQQGLQERVHFFVDVPHSQVAGFFQQAEIFCLPSRQEAFGLVLLEAGAFALPVIASNVGGIAELIEDRVNGLLVPAQEAAALTAGLRTLLDTPLLAQRLGAQLHHHVAAQFTWARTLEQYRAPRPLPAPDTRLQ